MEKIKKESRKHPRVAVYIKVSSAAPPELKERIMCTHNLSADGMMLVITPPITSEFLKVGQKINLTLMPPDLDRGCTISATVIRNDHMGLAVSFETLSSQQKEVVEYLGYSITTNVRELEGALISLIAQSSLNKKSITLELAKQMIDKFVKNTAREVSIDYIQKVVCEQH